MARKAYKALWQAAEARARAAEIRAGLAEQERNRWRTGGAKRGQWLLENAPTGFDGPLEYALLDFMCCITFLEVTARYEYPNGGFSQSYCWRGKPIQLVQS